MKKLTIEEIQVQIKRVVTFWKSEFGIDIPETDVIPEQPGHLPYLSWRPDISLRNCDEKLTKYKEKFGEDDVYCFYSSIDKSIQTQQDRPEESYWYWHAGGAEPDTEHLGKSYNVFSKENTNYMVPFEGIAFAYEYRLETGKMLDIVNLTYFHAQHYGGDVIGMYGNSSGQIRVISESCSFISYKHGPREISF